MLGGDQAGVAAWANPYNLGFWIIAPCATITGDFVPNTGVRTARAACRVIHSHLWDLEALNRSALD